MAEVYYIYVLTSLTGAYLAIMEGFHFPHSVYLWYWKIMH